MAKRQRDDDDQVGPLYAVIRGFLGVKDSAPRQSIGDNQFSILNNAMPSEDGNLQSISGHSAAIYTAAGGLTIINHRAVVRNNNNYIIMFLSDGSAVELQVQNGTNVGAPVTVGPAGTFSGGSTLNGRNVYSSTGDWNNALTLIIDPTKGYFSWDGTTRTRISATVKGYTIAAYGGRAIIGNGRTYTVTGTGGYNDLVTANGFATYTLNGDNHIGDILLIRASVSYLYICCASGIAVIGTIQFTNSLNYFQVQPYIAGTGTAVGTDVVDFDGLLFYVHTTGIYALTGPQPQLVSYDVRGTVGNPNVPQAFPWGSITFPPGSSIFTNNPAGLSLVGGIGGLCYINGIRMPVFMGQRWTGSAFYPVFLFFPDAIAENAAGGISAVGRWFTGDDIVSGTSLGIISTVSVSQDGMPWLWGISSTKLYCLFSVAANSLKTTIQTKLFDFGNAIINKEFIAVGVEGTFQTGTSIAMTGDSETGSVPTGNSPFITPATTNIQQLYGDAPSAGKYQGVTLTFTSHQWQITGFLFEYQEGTTE